MEPRGARHLGILEVKTLNKRMNMRSFINAVALMEAYDSEGFRLPEGFVYFSNCTDTSRVGPYLSDMVDNAKKITYKQFMAAVGEHNVRPVFSDYQWGRGRDLKMKDDPYVDYYQSTFRGLPCYYIRQSGIEWVFIRPDDYETAMTRPSSTKRQNKKTVSFLPDGSIAGPEKAPDAFVRGDIVKGKIRLTTSRFPSPQEAKAVLDYLAKNPNLTPMWDDDDDATPDEVIEYFQKAAKQ